MIARNACWVNLSRQQVKILCSTVSPAETYNKRKESWQSAILRRDDSHANLGKVLLGRCKYAAGSVRHAKRGCGALCVTHSADIMQAPSSSNSTRLGIQLYDCAILWTLWARSPDGPSWSCVTRVRTPFQFRLAYVTPPQRLPSTVIAAPLWATLSRCDATLVHRVHLSSSRQLPSSRRSSRRSAVRSSIHGGISQTA